MTWVKTGIAVATVPELTPHEVVLGAQTLVVVRLGGTVHALDGICPHIGGLLAEGTVESGRIVCPMHGATFALDTGAVIADPFGVSPRRERWNRFDGTRHASRPGWSRSTSPAPTAPRA